MAWVYDSRGRIIGTTTPSTAKTPQQEKEEYRVSQARESAAQRAVVRNQASERQRSYIRSLLRRYDGGGFSGLVPALLEDSSRVDGLTKAQASEVIDSLTENY